VEAFVGRLHWFRRLAVAVLVLPGRSGCVTDALLAATFPRLARLTLLPRFARRTRFPGAFVVTVAIARGRGGIGSGAGWTFGTIPGAATFWSPDRHVFDHAGLRLVAGIDDSERQEANDLLDGGFRLRSRLGVTAAGPAFASAFAPGLTRFPWLARFAGRTILSSGLIFALRTALALAGTLPLTTRAATAATPTTRAR
jgi:hypothetical protein